MPNLSITEKLPASDGGEIAGDLLYKRSVRPEILDTLEPGNPAAVASRRDLRLFNFVMGNERWIEKTLRRELGTGDRILELGAGGGRLALRLLKSGWDVSALDRCAEPAEWPKTAVWHPGTVQQFDGWEKYTVVVANLFLHHLKAEELRAVFERFVSHGRLLIACEPARVRHFARLFSILCGISRAHEVSRHDGKVSIAAGFRGEELATEMGIDRTGWNTSSRTTFRGAYHFLARRRL